MSNERESTHGVMEGGGSYNRHARVPAGGGNLALPFLERAAKQITLDGSGQPIIIADYGASQGKNSLAPMRAAIMALRARIGPDRPIFVVHIDQAANDFNTLFDVLHHDPERYCVDDPNIFPSAIGRSFYQSVFPREYVHLGWSSYAAVWLLAPKAKVLENRLYVEDGGCYSSAGITAGVDLMLHILSQLTDQSCAVAVARYLVVYMRRGGDDPQLSPWLEGRNHIHPAVHRVQDAIAADLANSWNLSRLAKIAGAGDRHLSRLFNENVGMSIKDYTNRLRVALAKELLGQTRLDMECVAERVGFASSRQLRRAWRRIYPTAPRQARNRSNS
jgi:AraC-like DNA-binding protein